LSLPGRT